MKWTHFKSFERNSVDRSVSKNAGSGKFFDCRNERIESGVQIVKTLNNNLLQQLENTERMLYKCQIFAAWVRGGYFHTKNSRVEGFSTHYM